MQGKTQHKFIKHTEAAGSCKLDETEDVDLAAERSQSPSHVAHTQHPPLSARPLPNAHDEVFDVDEALVVLLVAAVQADSYAHLIAIAKTERRCKSSDKAETKLFTERDRGKGKGCP